VQERQWDLSLSHPSAEVVRALDQPKPGADRMSISIVLSSAQNEARFRLGVMEHRQNMSLRLLLLNSSKPLSVRDLKVTTTLAGIPRPLVTNDSPQVRLAYRLFPFAFCAFFIVFAWISLREMRERSLTRNFGAIIRYALGVIFGCAMGGYYASHGAAWLISRFL